MAEKSDFGKGLTYCLGLFLAHEERGIGDDRAEIWFNGASDHLYELQISDSLPDTLKSRLEAFKDLVLDCGHGFVINRPTATKKDVQWALLEAMNLLMEIDKLHGIEVEEAEWK